MRLLVDVSGLVYRAAYKLHLTDAAGRNVGAAYGTIKTLGHLADLYEPEEMVICWDAGHEPQSKLYPAYKADRKRDPEFVADLSRQKDILLRMTSCLPVIHVVHPGLEADDLVAVLAKFLRMEDVGIVTGDTDLYCLSGKRCRIIRLDGVPAKLDLKPDQYITYKVLVGGEDGIKGVAGVGDVKARELIEAHGTLEDILRFSGEQGGLGKMDAGQVRVEVERNLKLMTPGALLTEAQRTAVLDQYRYGRLARRIDQSAFRKALMEHGFVSIVSRLPGFLQPFRRMEWEHAKAKAENQSEGSAESRSRGEDHLAGRVRWTKYVRKVDSRVRVVRKVYGGAGAGGAGAVPRGAGQQAPRGAAARAAEVLTRVRAQAFDGLAAPSDGQGPQGTVQHLKRPARVRGAGVPAADVPQDAPILPRRPVVSKALSVLQSLRSGEGWQWLRSRPTEDLQRFLSLIDKVLVPGKQVPFDDEEFLVELGDAFTNDLPSFMQTSKELKTHAKNILKSRVYQRP